MRLFRVIPLVCAFLLAGAMPAFAHVTVIGDGSASGGSDAIITFRVPTESDTASTTKLTVALPTDTPMASVDMLAMPGWTETQTSINLSAPIHTDDGDITTAVSRVTWTAQPGYEIKPGSFGEFSLIAGQLPDVKSLTFKALQTYSDNKVVSWIQVPAAGQTADSVDFPAPVLTLGAAGAAGADASSPSVSATTSTQPASTAVPTILAVVAVVLALVACAIAVMGRRGLGARTSGDAVGRIPGDVDSPRVSSSSRS